MGSSIFKVGDRVKCIKAYEGNLSLVGKICIIKSIKDNNVCLQFDANMAHGWRDGSNANKCCWNVASSYIEPVAMCREF